MEADVRWGAGGLLHAPERCAGKGMVHMGAAGAGSAPHGCRPLARYS